MFIRVSSVLCSASFCQKDLRHDDLTVCHGEVKFVVCTVALRTLYIILYICVTVFLFIDVQKLPAIICGRLFSTDQK